MGQIFVPLIRCVSCPACVGLKHVHGEKMCLVLVPGETQVRDFFRNLIENVHCDSFRAWVLVKNRHVIQVRVVHRAADFTDCLFQLRKIHEHSALIEFAAFYMSVNLVIVSVQSFTLAVIVPEKMCRREISLNSYFKHVWIMSHSAEKSKDGCAGFPKIGILWYNLFGG